MIGHCKHCQVDIFDDWQDCDCFPRRPEVVKKPKREQGASGDWYEGESVEDYNQAIAEIEDVPEGSWNAIVARQKMDRVKKGFYEGREPEVTPKHLTKWNEND
jgi:hypothetical protein